MIIRLIRHYNIEPRNRSGVLDTNTGNPMYHALTRIKTGVFYRGNQQTTLAFRGPLDDHHITSFKQNDRAIQNYLSKQPH